jgi:hypothetical protein
MKTRPRAGSPQFPFPRFGRETGGESPIPDFAGIGNREIPRFPIRPGPGIAVPGPGSGSRGPPGISWPACRAFTVRLSPQTLNLNWKLSTRVAPGSAQLPPGVVGLLQDQPEPGPGLGPPGPGSLRVRLSRWRRRRALRGVWAAGLEEPRIATHPRFEAAGRYRSNLSTL